MDSQKKKKSKREKGIGKIFKTRIHDEVTKVGCIAL